ncbi:hypothetical protein ACHQM5_020335 [Ranunculus cassubicifolius]
MAATLLEQTRSYHEEIERMERIIGKDLQNQSNSDRDRLIQNHRIKTLIDSITSTTQKLIEIYDDRDNSRKDEIATAFGGNKDLLNVSAFKLFYDRLHDIHGYYRRYPNSSSIVEGNDYEERLLRIVPEVRFSGEEGFGRYLDLHKLYNEYVNSKFGRKIEYSEYLDVFAQASDVEKIRKFGRRFGEYLEHLLEYLVGFFKRIDPLQDLDGILSKVDAEFEELWDNGKIEGFGKKGEESLGCGGSGIDLECYNTVEELVEVGLERLKEGLAALGLKVGGTVKQRAERLFLTKNTPLEKLDKKHFAKGSAGVGLASVSEQPGYMKQISLLQIKVKKLCHLLGDVIVRTKENVVRKQALTYDELKEEYEERERSPVDTDSDGEEEQTYNPLNLPMGEDGKPIPFWLYKLHGLCQKFSCEICGDYSYTGRRNFERHFKEPRHQHGMHCLGIPNSKDFYEITLIEEAKALWTKIQEMRVNKRWRPDVDEEKEDDDGNIYDKKTYTLLKRQNVI